MHPERSWQGLGSGAAPGRIGSRAFGWPGAVPNPLNKVGGVARLTLSAHLETRCQPRSAWCMLPHLGDGQQAHLYL